MNIIISINDSDAFKPKSFYWETEDGSISGRVVISDSGDHVDFDTNELPNNWEDIEDKVLDAAYDYYRKFTKNG